MDPYGNIAILFNETLTEPNIKNTSYVDIETNMRLSILRGEKYLKRFEDYNWAVFNMTSSRIKIKFFFNDTYGVSHEDIIQITFLDPFYFVSQGKLLIENLTLTQRLR